MNQNSNMLIEQWQAMNQPAQHLFAQTMSEWFNSGLMSSKALQQINTQAFSALLDSQANMLKMNRTALTEALHSFDTVMQNSTTRKLNEQGAFMVAAYMDSFSIYLTEIKHARSIQDMVMAQTTVARHFQTKMQDTLGMSIK